MDIVVDTREKDGPLTIFQERITVLNNLMKTAIKWRTEQISVGDFVIRENELVKVIVERKTWADLASSIVDGRATSQLKKMTDFRDAHGCVLIYIIEGKKPASMRISPEALTTKIRRIALLSISVIYTKNIQDTVDTIIKLTNDVATQRVSVAKQETEVNSETAQNAQVQNAQLHSRNESTEEEQLINMWKCLPGVGDHTAKILHNNMTIGELLRSKSPIDTLCKINAICQGAGVKINDKTRNTLKYLMTTSTIAEKEGKKYGDIFGLEQQKIAATMLGCIYGLSTETAMLILKQYSMRDLCTNAVEVGNISDITRVSGRKIGYDLAVKIKNILGVVR